MPGLKEITIFKRDLHGSIRWQYSGNVISIAKEKIVIEAIFDREATPVGDSIINPGDRFIETYYTDRWYNILEIHDHFDDHIKGWYCDIGRPVQTPFDNILFFDDLELDLWVNPNGQQLVLDLDKFNSLDIDQKTREHALEGLLQVRKYFQKMFEVE
jgi:predicted RNA-binding protein associated with RNAse of E/G family